MSKTRGHQNERHEHKDEKCVAHGESAYILILVAILAYLGHVAKVFSHAPRYEPGPVELRASRVNDRRRDDDGRRERFTGRILPSYMRRLRNVNYFCRSH